MNEFDDFRKGWWNCFLTFAEINEFYADSNDMSVLDVLESGGVSNEEIDAVLNDDSFQISERLVKYLNWYKNKKIIIICV